MDDNPIKRFRERQKRRVATKNESMRVCHDVSQERINALFDEQIDEDFLRALWDSQESHYAINFDVDVSEAEVSELLEQLEGKVTAHEFDLLLGSVKERVLGAVIKPFGLAKIIFQDKNGSNVTTIHNMKQPDYKVDVKDEYRYDRDDYAGYPAARSMDDYKKSRIDYRQKIKDEFTGEPLEVEQAETDHIRSLKSFHNDGGFMLSKERKAKFGADRNNYAMTKREINRSKSDKDLKDFEATTIQSQTINNKERFDSDGRRTSPAAIRGEKTAQKHLPTQKEKIEHYATDVMSTGGFEAAKMGLQQAIGVLLYELADGIIVETRNLFHNWRDGTMPSGLFGEIKARFLSLGDRLISKWKNVISAFVQGGIAGFISNLVTFIINCFKTTLGRVGRIIREGSLSLIHAFKMLAFPPEGMTLREAAHEATKLVVAGLAVAAGLGIEEFVSKTLMMTIPILAPFTDAITTVVVGILTGIGSAVLVYTLDKIDFFGVNRERHHLQIMGELEKMAEDARADTDKYFEIFSLPSVPPEPV